MNTIIRSLKKNHLIAFVILILSAGNIFGQDSVPGTALNFDGVDDYINCGNPANLSFPGTAPFTFEAWVKPAVNNISGDIITKFNLNVEGEYSLTIRNGKASTHREAPPYNISGTTLLQQDTWYHIASVYDGANLSIYLNGMLENSASSGAITGRSTSVIIGAEKQSDNPAVFFNGQIDEVRVWNVARTVEEIREKIGFTLEGSEPGLVSYWQFNEGSDTTAFDFVSSNNGILHNMTNANWVTSTVPVNLFRDINAGLPGVGVTGSASWGDFDNDGDLDILLAGSDISKIYRNDPSAGPGNIFTDINADLAWAGYDAAGSWGDYDNDGDLDIIISGTGGTRLYNNNSGVFTYTNSGLPKTYNGLVNWGDYDNDGDLDILVNAGIYQNEGGKFHFVTGFSEQYGKFGDYDNDGDLDILMCGGLDFFEVKTVLYQNNAGLFSAINTNLLDMGSGSIDWSDYDSDGDLDILMAGGIVGERDYVYEHLIIYRNDGLLSGTEWDFVDINAGLTGVFTSTVAWGDYNNDGYPDAVSGGYYDRNLNLAATYIYRSIPKTGSERTFINSYSGMEGLVLLSAAWGDYDNDGDLDLLLTGIKDDLPISRIWQNNGSRLNTKPLAPDGLTDQVNADSFLFSWNKAIDIETAQDGLSYNLVIGNAAHNIIIKPAGSDETSGFRHIPKIGNVCLVNAWWIDRELYNHPQVIGPDYWGVQTIDNSFSGSPFTYKSIKVPIIYISTINYPVMQTSDLLSWEVKSSEFLTDYIIQIDDDSTFSSCEVNDTISVSLSGSGYYYGVSLSDLKGKTNLIPGTYYYWGIKPNYTFGLPTAFTKPAPSFHYMFVTDIDESAGKTIPEKFALHQNYPNPFNPVTTIGFSIARTEHVNLTIFNVKGQEMLILVNQPMAPGSYKAQIDAHTWPSGLYFYQLTAGGKQMVKRMILMK